MLFEFFPWGWFLVSVPCGPRKCLIWFQFSWICWGLLCVLSCGLSLKMFHVHLKRMYILVLWDERFSILPLSLFNLGHCSMPQYPCWYFVWKLYPLLTAGFFFKLIAFYFFHRTFHLNCVEIHSLKEDIQLVSITDSLWVGEINMLKT